MFARFLAQYRFLTPTTAGRVYFVELKLDLRAAEFGCPTAAEFWALAESRQKIVRRIWVEKNVWFLINGCRSVVAWLNVVRENV